MSRSNSLRFVRNAAFLVGGIGAVIAGTYYAQFLARIDPFASRRGVDVSPLGKRVAIRLEDVTMTQWHGAKQEAECKIDRIDVMENRQELTFYDVHDGVYRGEKGDFKFATERADWNAVRQQVQFAGLTTVKNKDVDLSAKGFGYDQKKQLLDIPGNVEGKFFDGTLKAQGVVYNLKNDTYEVGPSEWSGNLKLQETGAPSRWNIRADRTKNESGKQLMTNIWASDGEIIVKAPKAERDLKTDVITATGNVEYYGLEANLVADKVVVDRKAKKATLTGNVRMLIKPKDQQKLEETEIPPFRPLVPESVSANRPPAPLPGSEDEVSSTKNLRRYPIAVSAAKIEYWYAKGSRRAIITGSPQAQQELGAGLWRRGWAYQAFYDGEKETLKLTSSKEGEREARMKNSRQEDIKAEWFEFSTKEGDEDNWEAYKMIGDVLSSDDDIPRSKATNKPPPNGGGGLRGPIGRF
jgi:lipopolysaccharide export system protein LptA